MFQLFAAMAAAFASGTCVGLLIADPEAQRLRRALRPFDRDGDGRPGGSRKRVH